MKRFPDPEAVRSSLERYGWSGVFSSHTEAQIRLAVYEPGEYLLRSGEKIGEFLLYIQGRSKVFRSLENGQTMLVRFYFPFQIMGDLELFTGKTAVNSVIAVDEVRCLYLPMETVRRELESNVPLLNRLALGLAEKLAAFNATSAVNMNYPLRTRLADYLCLICLEEGQFRDELETTDMGEMASFLGCSYRHLTRTMEEFKREGILEKRGGQTRILDPDKLREISGDVFRNEFTPS